jgi:DNA-directed RNA polymerase subunit RPC12/RpoP
MFSLYCTICGKKIGMPEQYAGRRARCPGCQRTMILAAQQMTPSPAKQPQGALSTPLHFSSELQAQRSHAS